MKLPHHITATAIFIGTSNSVLLAVILPLVYFINRTKNCFGTTHA